MPTAYIKKLSDDGKGSVAELEKKWDKAKEIAKDAGETENYAYITGIFKKIIGESKMKFDKLYESIMNEEKSVQPIGGWKKGIGDYPFPNWLYHKKTNARIFDDSMTIDNWIDYKIEEEWGGNEKKRKQVINELDQEDKKAYDKGLIWYIDIENSDDWPEEGRTYFKTEKESVDFIKKIINKYAQK